jgi:hypothetical protein
MLNVVYFLYGIIALIVLVREFRALFTTSKIVTTLIIILFYSAMLYECAKSNYIAVLTMGSVLAVIFGLLTFGFKLVIRDNDAKYSIKATGDGALLHNLEALNWTMHGRATHEKYSLVCRGIFIIYTFLLLLLIFNH